MAETDFLDVVDLVDWIGVESNSSRAMKNEVPILKQELRSLTTFLKHTASRCTEDENLQHLFARIGDVGPALVKLHDLAASSRARKPAVDDAVRNIQDKIKQLKPQIRNVQMSVLLSSASGTRMIEGPVVEFIDSAQDLFKPEVRELQIQVSGLSISDISDPELIEFIETLQEDLEGLLGCETDLLEGSVKEGIKVLKRKLGFLKALLSLTAHRCNEHDKLKQLLTHVRAVLHAASCLATYCLTDETDDDKKRKLALVLFNLAQKIDPVTPEVREIYIGVLKGSASSHSQPNILQTDETLADFVDSLLENTWGLLCGDMMPVIKDQIEILHVELRSLEYLIKDVDKDTKDGKSIDFLALAEAIIIDAGYVIYSLPEGDVKQELAKETRLALSNLLDKFKHGKALIRKSFLNIKKAKISNFPRTNGRRALDILLQNLEELLNDRVASIEVLKDHIQIIQRDLQFLLSVLPSVAKLRSFLSSVTEQHHEHEKIEDLWWRIIHVVYEVEHVIDLVIVKDGPVLHHILWLSDLIEEIKLIKTEINKINKIQIPDKNMDELQGHEISKISSEHGIRSRKFAGIDEQTVGFKDDVTRIEDELLSGSRQLQIISIVGMPGLGKTSVARRVYNGHRIINHFYVCGWCCVSQQYERKGLLIEILSQIKKNSREMTEWADEELAEMLWKSLKGQRYLIVLDDIWDIEGWNVLERSFPDDGNGSRIIFTSRFSELASQTKLSSKIHELQPLSSAESWELLERKVFGTKSCPLELHEIGEKIANNCHGLPLSIVVVAGLLARIEAEEAGWRRIADNLSSHSNNEFVKLVMDIIDLSYKNLPDYLKSCFLYCGAFLPAKEIRVAKLIWKWIAEGFVQGNNPNLEYTAKGYLMDLIDRNLIIASKGRSGATFKACLVHDLIRNFCIEKAKGENFLQLIEASANLLPSSDPSSYEQRRLSVHYKRREKFWSKSSGPFVRTLLLFAPGRLDLGRAEVSSIILGFKLLKVLDLMCINLGLTFPGGIASLALLRYLAVSGGFKSLPSSISNLGKLESFLVRAVQLISLSYDDILKNMTKLRHLHIDDQMFLVRSSSHNRSQLDSLQTLSTPSFSRSDDIEVLKRFPKLKKLRCILEESWDFSGLWMLGLLRELESLKISYHGMTKYRDPQKLIRLYYEFDLPQNVKKLTMSGFRLPWKLVCIIAKLPNLEVLKLLDEAFEGEEWNMDDDVFQKLKFLKLESLDIRRWIASDDSFPLLEQLILDGCYYLEEIPSCLEGLPTLKMIQAEECSDSLETCITRIEEEQRDIGNEELQIKIKRHDSESCDSLHIQPPGTLVIEVPATESDWDLQDEASMLPISALSDSQLIEFIDTVQEDLKRFLRGDTNFLPGSMKEGIEVLQRKLGFLKALLSLTAHGCNEPDKLKQLFSHVQAAVNIASGLATYCLTAETDDEKHRLVPALYSLSQKIGPVTREVREIYIGVLKGSTLSQSKSNILQTDETLADFVDSLLEITTGLLCGDKMPVKDQIEILHVELRSLGYLIKDVGKDTKDGKSTDFLALEAIMINAGYVIYSLFEGDFNQELANETRQALSNLLDQFKHAKAQIRKSFLNIEKARISNFPRTYGRRALDILLQKLEDLLNDRVTSIELLKDHIQIIQRDLRFLQSVLPLEAELRSLLSLMTEQHHEHEKIEDLWWRSIHVVYEVEYVIDLFTVKDGPVLHHILWLTDLIEEIKLIKTEIDENNKIQLRGHEISKISSGLGMWSGYASRIDKQMVGFKDDVTRIEDELLSGSRQLQIISIMGMPGLGKTSVARRVYDGHRIINHFYVCGWCCVSQQYERKGLLIEILSQIKKNSREMTEWAVEELAEMLWKSLKGQRYLIVIDDIWDIEGWNMLERSFPDDGNGSRIIFTSRFSELASQTKLSSKIHELQPLSPAESWELLERKVFGTKSCPLKLHEIGQKIANNCHGVPLSIVVVAGLLARIEAEEAGWRRIADNLSSHSNNEFVRLVMDIIDLSYKNLPEYLKSCFLYCGAFPPAKKIRVTELIWKWIAEGFVQGNNPNLEYIAKGYLMDLIDRNLIIASQGTSGGTFKACLVHDLIRNFCIEKAKGENFLQLIEASANLLPSSHPSSYEQRRLSVHYKRREKFWSKSSGPSVHTLLLFAPGRLDLGRAEVSSIILGFKLLKVLDLMCINLGEIFPEGLSSLALLRYLAISGGFKSLPSSISNLGKLESFLIRAIHLISLSYGDILKNMTKLRHLHVDDRMFLVQSSSDNHSQLGSLQTLSATSFSCSDDMEVLMMFPNLKKLSCIFEESCDLSGLWVLELLSELESLKICYHGMMTYPCDEFSLSQNITRSSNEFRLPQNIKKLTMSGFRLPWELSHIIGELPNLEVLKLLDNAFEGCRWEMPFGFPKLKFLKLEHLNIRIWIADTDINFPPLEQLILNGCYYLEQTPSHLEGLPTLKMVQVEDCSDSLDACVIAIQEEQKNFGNEEPQIIIRRRNSESGDSSHIQPYEIEEDRQTFGTRE